MITLPTEPVFSSFAPYTTVDMRALIIAPAHMGQGSSVTKSAQPERFQAPSAAQAARMASTSAWAVASRFSSRRLRPRPIISPEGETTTQPTGTSPFSAASRANDSASSIYFSYSIIFHLGA